MGAAAPAIIGLGLQVAGGVTGAVSERRAAKNAKREAGRQAAVLQANAELALSIALRNADLRRLQGQKLEGAQRAAAGASGITFDGSFQDVVAESARVAEFEAQDIEFGGQQQRLEFLNQASQLRRTGRITAGALNLSSMTTLLGTGAKAFSTVSKLVALGGDSAGLVHVKSELKKSGLSKSEIAEFTKGM